MGRLLTKLRAQRVDRCAVDEKPRVLCGNSRVIDGWAPVPTSVTSAPPLSATTVIVRELVPPGIAHIPVLIQSYVPGPRGDKGEDAPVLVLLVVLRSLHSKPERCKRVLTHIDQARRAAEVLHLSEEFKRT